MPADYITLVSGLARCGSSATMQALRRGGMDLGPIARHPYNEDPRATECIADPSWLEEYIGKALKWIDPELYPLPKGHPLVRSIWLTRNDKQQAKSTIKYMRHHGQRVAKVGVDWTGVTRSDVPRRQQMLKNKTPVCLARLRRAGPVLVVSFEGLVSRPLDVCGRIAAFLDPHELDPERMAGAIVPRSAKCADEMLEPLFAAIGPKP